MMSRTMKDYFVRKWDETDEWACRTFGRQPETRKTMFRNAMEKSAGQKAFDALFCKPATA